MNPSRASLVLAAFSLMLSAVHGQQEQIKPAAAAKPPPAGSPEAVFKRLDKNGDGFIATDELAPERRDIIKRLDRDNDGRISYAEHMLGIVSRPAAPPASQPARPVAAPTPDTVDARLDVPYADNTNPRQQLDLYLPKKRSSDKPLPVIVYIHGGAWKGGSKAEGMRPLLPYVAAGDYAGVSVAYRLTNEAQWPAQIHDCKAAIRWIRGHAKEFNLDPDHIAAWGVSAGGHLVSMLGTSGGVGALEGRLGSFTGESSRVQAVVNYFGPENFVTMSTQKSTVDRTVQNYPEALLIGGRVQDLPDAAKNASPVTYISKDDPPFLTAHGTEDPLVPFEQATELNEKLLKAGASSVLVTMQKGGHGFASRELDDLVHRFLDRHLRGLKAEIDDRTIDTTASGQGGDSLETKPRSN